MNTGILHLTLRRIPFEVMVSGEKQVEFREPSTWILARLTKKYSKVKFVNGYGKNRPFFIAEFKHWDIANIESEYKYSNGLTVRVAAGTIRIFLGQILEAKKELT